MYMTTLSYRYQPCLDHLQWMGQYKKQPAFQLSDLAQEFVFQNKNITVNNPIVPRINNHLVS